MRTIFNSTIPNKKLTVFFHQTFLILAGCILCAVAVKSIIIPQEFLSRGLTGLALMFYYKWPVLSVGTLFIIANIPVFIMGWRLVGKRFAFYSLWGLIIYSGCLTIIDFQLSIPDRLLAAIIAGALFGVGTAIIMRSYGSCGGTDILCVIFHRKFSLTLGSGILLINSVVLLISAIIYPLENILYTIVFIFVSAQLTDKVFQGMAKRKAAIIISQHWKPISEALIASRFGVTLLHGQGGFRGTERILLYSVLSSNSVEMLKNRVMTIDPGAFIAIMEADDVTSVEVGNQPHWFSNSQKEQHSKEVSAFG